MRKTQPLSEHEREELEQFVAWVNEYNAEQEYEKRGRQQNYEHKRGE